jgi:hypothetical protein
MAGLIYMVSLLYSNEDFETTNNIAKFEADITMENQPFTQSYVLETSLDKKNNKVYLQGEIVALPEYSHEVLNEGFYTLNISIPRLSGQSDIIPVTTNAGRLICLIPS